MRTCHARQAAEPRCPSTGSSPSSERGVQPMKRTLLFSCFLLTCAAPGWGQAQVTTGVIQGTVTDPTGAAVPEARVEARNLDTNFTRSQDTDGAGRFAFLQMPPGRYTVTASKPGFATIVQGNVELTV